MFNNSITYGRLYQMTKMILHLLKIRKQILIFPPWLTTLRGSAESSWAQYVLLMNVFYIFDDFLWICHTLIENTKPTVVYPKNYQRPLKNKTFWWIVNLYTQTLVHHPPPLPDRNSVMEILYTPQHNPAVHYRHVLTLHPWVGWAEPQELKKEGWGEVG